MSGRNESMPPRSRPAAGGELDNQARAMLAQSLEKAAEPLWVGGRALVVVAHMAMRDRCAGLEGFLCALDLLGNGDRYRRIIGFARQAACDRHADDARLRHHRSIS